MNIQNSLAGSVNLFAFTKRLQSDYVVFAAVILLSLLYVQRVYNPVAYPYEDAAMIMRYAEHLAEGHGIVWNIGEEPVDGATDFLFMVMVAGVIKLGFSVDVAIRLLTFGAHFLNIGLIYFTIRNLLRSSQFVAVISALFFAFGAGVTYVEAFFGTPVFALAVSITWYFALKAILEGTPSLKTALLFSFSGLIAGLIRPEGVLVSGMMLLSILFINGIKPGLRVIVSFGAVFLVFGGAYMLWRWNYFGYPLPNPFYVKGGGALYADSLKVSVFYVAQHILPFILFFVLGFRKPTLARQTIGILITVVGFTLMWVFLTDDMNYERRFQYAILPVVMMSWGLFTNGLMEEWKIPRFPSLSTRQRATAAAFVGVVCLVLLGLQFRTYSGIGSFQDGRYDVAWILNDYRDKGYIIAQSEAGLLPFYSEWNSIDTRGLNNQWIAHNGGVTAEYLDRYEPEIVMFYSTGFSPLGSVPWGGRWYDMTVTLKEYAEANDYVLAAAYGVNPYIAHYYYVRPDFADSQEIIERIRNLDYRWWSDGQPCVNYAAFLKVEAADGLPYDQGQLQS